MIEAALRISDGKQRLSNGQTEDVKFKYLAHTKTYLTCIPTKIVRHKNPLSFLDIAAKYTMSFVDAAGEHITFRLKTLSEILGGLRDYGYVLRSDGAEGALGAMIQAYKETKLIVDNEDIEFTGFFLDDNGKLIASHIEIRNEEVSKTDLKDSLVFINEVTKYYQGRLDLLATSIIWAMVSPVSFILKSIGSFLKWLHFWGFTNASKSSTGKIILAVDGHHNDSRYVLNISNIDTIARLGEAIGKTTFPKLVDEVAFGETLKFMINQLKSAIENKILRTKFMNSKSGTSTDIPSLSPLIMTSNPPPPFHDSAYMRRVIERSFSQSESHKEDEQMALEFRELLRTNLDRLKHLGDFRNWFIMHNQDVILDKKLTPMELGKKILVAAYEYAGVNMPEWYDKLLPENQLEESLADNEVIVKRAFEALINDYWNHSISYLRAEEVDQNGKPIPLKMPVEISSRLVKLIDSNLIPDIKRDKEHNIIIYSGILGDLVKYGVTRDQLPSLKALADYMGANYAKIHPGKNVIKTTIPQIAEYLDEKCCNFYNFF